MKNFKCICTVYNTYFVYLNLFIYSTFHVNIYTYRGIYIWIKGLDSRLGLYWSSPRLGYCTATTHTYIAIDMHNNLSLWLNNLNNCCRQMKGKTETNKNSTHIIWSWVQYILIYTKTLRKKPQTTSCLSKLREKERYSEREREGGERERERAVELLHWVKV